MPYAHTSLSAFRASLSARLDDTALVRWPAPELDSYIRESLRTWNSLALYHRARDQFQTTPGQPFYDLSVNLPSLMGYTIRDSDLVNDLCFALMETPPSTPGVWNGTDQFSMPDLVGAIERRRNQFLLESGCVLTHLTMSAIGSPPVARVPLDDRTVDVRRVAFLDAGDFVSDQPTAGQSYGVLWRTDEKAALGFARGYNLSPGWPIAFSTMIVPPVTLALIPPAANDGRLSLIIVQTGAPLDGTGVLLGIPDDHAQVVKWGALSDVLGRDGQARDPARAAYCETRWRQGVEAARLASSVFTAFVNDVQVPVISVQELDGYRTSWQVALAADGSTPDVIALASWNLLATGTVPDAIYGLELDCVRNAPVPVLDGDFIQLGREELDAVIGYCEHLALLKEQGAEWQATQIHFENFVRLAATYNERLKASASFVDIVRAQSMKEEKVRPRRDLVNNTNVR